MNYKIYTWLFVLLIIGAKLRGQVIFEDYTIEGWLAKDGLPTEQILNIAIDTHNFIWLNTYEGLAKFDGINFKVYSAGSHPEIKSNNLYNPVIDKNNNLWATTQFGKLIKIKNGQLETYPLPFQMDRIIAEFENGDYLSFTPKGERVIFNPQTQNYKLFNASQYKEFTQALNNYGRMPYRMAKLDDGRTMVLIGRTLYWLTVDSMQYVNEQFGVLPAPWSAAALVESSQGELFLVGDDVLKIWKNDRFVIYPGCEDLVINTTGGRQHKLLVEDRKGNLWLGTANGPALRRKGNVKFEFLAESHPLWSKIVTALQVDPENNLWVGTENGLYKITEGKIKMISKYLDIPFLRTTGVTQLPSGSIYINVPGRNSFYRYDQGALKPVKLKNSLLQAPWEAFHIHGDKKGNLWIGVGPSYKISPDGSELKFATNASIRYIYEDSADNIWFGVSSRGIGYLDGDSLKYLKFGDFSFRGQNVSSIRKINGEEWLITTFNNGLLWIDDNNTVTSIYDTLGYPGIGAFGTFQDKYGTFWVASANGLFYFNGQGFIKIIDHHEYLATSFFEIIDDQRGSLWLTSNKGIVQVHKTELEGFTSGKIPAVNALRYDEGDGMLNRQATGARHAIRTKEGLIMIPTLQGLAVIDPANIVKNTLPPQVIINGMYFNSKVVDTVSPQFKAGVHQYVFDYSATSYVAPGKVQFRYLLEGYDKQWSDLTTERKVTYTNLPKGSYTFRVKASNNDGVWNDTGASKSFLVKPYWYETWWFRIASILALAGLGYGLLNFRSKQILARNKVLHKMVNERTTELNQSNQELNAQKSSLENTLNMLKTTQTQLIQAEKMASLGELTAGIAHEIQNPLNFVNNFSEVNKELSIELVQELEKGNYTDAKAIAIDIKDNEEKIHHHGKRADGIVKNMLQHSQKSSGQKELTDINGLCDEYLRLAYHGLRAKDKNFNAKLDTQLDPVLPKLNVMVQDMGRVLLNLINNAFYAVSEKQKIQNERHDFMYEPTVSVSTKNQADKIEISVKDNGNGIPDAIKEKIFQPFFTTKPTGQGTGLGLSLSYDIVKVHGGELIVTTKEGEGSEFLIQLPVV